MDDFEHILQRQGLKIEPVGGVVVGRNSLGIAIDHDGLDSSITQCKGSVYAGVIELHSLTDAIWSTAKDYYLLPLRWDNLCELVVAAVVVRRKGWELPRTGVNRLENRPDPLRIALSSDLFLAHTSQLR